MANDDDEFSGFQEVNQTDPRDLSASESFGFSEGGAGATGGGGQAGMHGWDGRVEQICFEVARVWRASWTQESGWKVASKEGDEAVAAHDVCVSVLQIFIKS